MEIILQRLALGGYALSTLLAFGSLLARRKGFFALAPIAAGAGFVAHLGAFTITFQHLQAAQGSAIRNVLSALALIAVAIYLYGYMRYRLHVLGIFMLPLALLLFLFSGWLLPESVVVAPAYNQPLLRLHIAVSTLGVGALFLTFTFSVMYLVQEKALKQKRPVSFFLPLPSLSACDRVLYVSLMIGFGLLTIGLALAAVWSANMRGTFDIWQSQREILALVSWVIFGVVLYARLVTGWRGRKMAFLTIAGFAAVMLRLIGGPFL